jgi:hypothetical protein
MDRLVKVCRHEGIEIQCLLGYCAKWAAPEIKQASRDFRDWLFSPPQRMDAWREYVRETAKRYSKDVRFYEVWNEADLDLFWKGTSGKYLELLQAAHEEIKAASRDSQVMTCGFATLGPHPAHSERDFEAAVVRDGADFYDVLAHHEHGLFPGYQEVVDGPLAELVKRLRPPRRLWFNETAVSSVVGGELVQAETLVKKLCLAFARGSMGYTWYDLRNDGNDPADPEHNFGMLTRDFNPKPVYSAFNTLALLLAGKRFTRQIDLGEGRWAFVFSSEAEHVVAAWRESPAVPEGLYVLRMTDAANAVTYDMWGNPERTSVISDRIPLAVSSAPRFLVVQGPPEGPRLEGALVSPEGPIVAVPGRRAVFRAALYNPFDMPREFVLRWRLPAKATKRRETVKRCFMEPGARETRSWDVDVLLKAAAARGRSFDCELSYGIDGVPWKGRAVVPLAVAVPIPAAMPGRPPDFCLKERASYVGLNGNEPDSRSTAWRGPDDLSVRIWLSRGNDAMNLKVSVTDDVFCQRGTGSNVWQGDGVQFALAAPGQDGYWELGLTRMAGDGNPAVYVWRIPERFKDPGFNIVFQTERRETETLYEAVLPYQALGLSDEALEQGIQFNLIVNDSDGGDRKGWMEIAPGIGFKKDPASFPWIVFQPAAAKRGKSGE